MGGEPPIPSCMAVEDGGGAGGWGALLEPRLGEGATGEWLPPRLMLSCYHGLGETVAWRLPQGGGGEEGPVACRLRVGWLPAVCRLLG